MDTRCEAAAPTEPAGEKGGITLCFQTKVFPQSSYTELISTIHRPYSIEAAVP